MPRTTESLATARAISIAIALTTALSVGAFGCSAAPTANDDAAVACVSGLTAECSALYAPATFDTIYTKIFAPTCASGTGTCHTSDAAKGGLVFANADDAYARLVGTNGGRVRVVPSDPGCSLLMKRLASTSSTYRMPPGPDGLLEGERCTIVQWIAAGAQR